MSEQIEQFNIDEAIKELPLEEKVPVVALKKLLDQRQKIDEEQQQKIQAIKKKYHQQIKPLLNRASEILRGAALKPQEYAGAEEFLQGSQKLQNFIGGKKIDGYWNGVLSNSAIVDEINEEDEKALGYLVDIQQVENDPEDIESIELLFTFKPNPYFQEETIRRKLICKEGKAICIQGQELTWKDGVCLTHEMKNVTNKKTGEKKITKGKKIQSFFQIFTNVDSTNLANQQDLSWSTGIISELHNLVISNHIDFFLGLVNADGEEDSEEDDEQDAEDEEEK